MSIWFAYTSLGIFLLYLLTIAFLGDVINVSFVERHHKNLWNVAGLLFFVFVGFSVAVSFTN